MSGGLFVALISIVAIEEIRISSWKSDYSDLKEKYDKLEANYEVAKANNVTLSAALDAQNTSIEALKKKAVADKAKADAVAKAAISARKRNVVTGSGPAVMNAWIHREYGVSNEP